MTLQNSRYIKFFLSTIDKDIYFGSYMQLIANLKKLLNIVGIDLVIVTCLTYLFDQDVDRNNLTCARY